MERAGSDLYCRFCGRRRARALLTTADNNMARAEECARLANLTKDKRVQAELLRLRQTYLRVARTLEEIENEPPREQ